MNLTHSVDHWSDLQFNKTLLVDGLLKHLLGLALYGMSDVGEVLEVMVHLKPDDEECWVSTWAALAERLEQRAKQADEAGLHVTASSAYLRASTYWRASQMYFSRPSDPRMKDYSRASVRCYERHLALSGYPGEYVEIPYEGGFLPGHFYRSPVAGDLAPLLIITPGRDTWAEDTRWVYDGALKRGIHCLIYDGPGQGLALRLNDLIFRPDWEKVVTPVVDFALALPGVDPSRIGLMGLSFGGFLSVRAAAFEKRLKLCIADPGSLSWGRAIIDHFPQPVRDVLLGAGPDALRKVLTGTIELTSLEWLLRDYAWKHGVSHEEVFPALLAYDNSAVVDQIECETLVIDGTAEIAKGQAQQLFDALKCPKDYLLFDEASTAQTHSQMGSYATATELLFDWISRKL